MYLNQFSVRIPEGNETSGGYVEMQHDKEYTIVLRNSRDERCDARVEIDGKHVGTWRINAHSNIRLERPVHDEGKFTYYRLGTAEAERAQVDGNSPDLGLVRVVFTPEARRVYYHYHAWPRPHWQPWQPPWTPTYPTCTWETADNTSSVTYQHCLSEGGGTLSASCNYVANAGDVSPGGTGLSGHSDQKFYDVSALDYDYSQQTTINLRLIHREKVDMGPRPLLSASNPVPPRVY